MDSLGIASYVMTVTSPNKVSHPFIPLEPDFGQKDIQPPPSKFKGLHARYYWAINIHLNELAKITNQVK